MVMAGAPALAWEVRQWVWRAFQHGAGGEHVPAPRMASRQRVAGRVLQWRDEFARWRPRPDAAATLDDGPAGQTKDSRNRVPGRPFRPESSDPGVLCVGPDEFLGHGGPERNMNTVTVPYLTVYVN